MKFHIPDFCPPLAMFPLFLLLSAASSAWTLCVDPLLTCFCLEVHHRVRIRARRSRFLIFNMAVSAGSHASFLTGRSTTSPFADVLSIYLSEEGVVWNEVHGRGRCSNLDIRRKMMKMNMWLTTFCLHSLNDKKIRNNQLANAPGRCVTLCSDTEEASSWEVRNRWGGKWGWNSL